jgi:hypothetical protein
MNEIHLPMQKKGSTRYYVSEKQQYKRLKNNILLILAILAICFIIRISDTYRLSNVDESTKQLYFDVPSHHSPFNLNFSHIA